MTERHALNAPGAWYVDTRCIDCGASRTVAPGLIVERGGQSVFARQPVTAEERMAAWRARLLCPTASVRSETHVDAPADIFPEEMAESVYRLGYNARSSWGAHSFLICRRAGNTMVDAPRWSSQIVAALAARGGLADILLTHRDDVADAGRYAARFGARVWIHAADRDAAPFADQIVVGSEAVALAPDLLAIPVPGHTEGSVVYLYDRRCLFTGDSLAWSFERDDLTAFRDACWWSWPQQRRSLRRLLDYEFEWVLAGHGGSRHLPAAEMRTRLAALVERMGRARED
jgi:glyoxylase-like metal-dependent hydrolase (beta-lactamase superfamily II)